MVGCTVYHEAGDNYSYSWQPWWLISFQWVQSSRVEERRIECVFVNLLIVAAQRTKISSRGMAWGNICSLALFRTVFPKGRSQWPPSRLRGLSQHDESEDLSAGSTMQIHLLSIQRPRSSFHLLLLQAFNHPLFVIHLIPQIDMGRHLGRNVARAD